MASVDLKQHWTYSFQDLRSCVKVEVAVLGSPSPTNLRMVFVDVKQHWTWAERAFPFQNVLRIKSLVCFSAIRGSGPAYLSELLHVYTPSRTLRSSSDTRMLEIQKYKRKTDGFSIFSCFGPHIWNSFSQNLRHCSTLSSFKAKLRTFLFSHYFHPN